MPLQIPLLLRPLLEAPIDLRTRDDSDEGVALARPQQEVLCIDGDGAAGDLHTSPNLRFG